MGDQGINDILNQVAKRSSDDLVKGAVGPLGPAIDLLKGYFSREGGLNHYPLDIQGSPFRLRVWSALRKISLGKIATYGEIAAKIGNPRGARAIGQACGSNPVVLFVPCHRVVSAQGKVGGFGGGLPLKRSLLHHEGVRIE
jgi:methylated-DNA-[protein]-cysteine S-methyltransferase